MYQGALSFMWAVQAEQRDKRWQEADDDDGYTYGRVGSRL